jgi:hypothetical protein
MAAFTPSNLYVVSLGSAKLSIAEVDEDILSGTNFWTSGIPDIVSVMPASSSALVVSWTASSGTIHVVNDASLSNTGYVLWVVSGLGQDVWNQPAT